MEDDRARAPEGYAPAPHGFGPPGGGFVPPGGPMTPGSGKDVGTTLPLLLAIASILVFCDPVLGLPAVILAVQARNARSVGSLDVARKRAKLALVLAGAGIVVGFLGEVFFAARWWF
jgi:hypothetical protein